jgi:hypothetical protein
VRKLLPLSVVLVLFLSVPAVAQEPAGPVLAPGFAESYPALRPIEDTPQPTAGTQASGALGLNDLALAAAIYWLLLGALALRRAQLRTPREDPVPIAGWVLGCAPPLPR